MKVLDLVIIEGKWNKSEHQFWKKLKQELFHSNVQIVCAESNSKIPVVLAKYLSVLDDKYNGTVI